MQQPAMYVKVVKRKKVIFLLVGPDETVESTRKRIAEFFPSVAIADIMMLKGELILSDEATLREEGVANGDTLHLRFFISGRGEGGFWDSADS